MLQIEQLNSTDYDITCAEQKQVFGSGAGSHNYIAPSSEKQEELWSGYASEDYDIEILDRYKNKSGTYVSFNRSSSDRSTSAAGVIKV